MIIDSHAHVMLPTEKQLSLMVQAGIDRTILFPTTPHPERAVDLPGFEREMRVLFEILSGNRSLDERIQSIRLNTIELCGTIKRHPDKFLGFGAVPLTMPFRETCEWIDRNVIANGLVGVGEFTLGSGSLKLLEVIFEALMEVEKIPVWIHAFHPLKLEDIKEIAELAGKFPEIPVVLGHMGGVNWLDAIKLAKERENMYLDLSGVFTAVAPWLAVKELPERTLFSSDAPYGHPGLARKMVETVCEDKQTAEMVMGGNITRLLQLE